MLVLGAHARTSTTTATRELPKQPQTAHRDSPACLQSEHPPIEVVLVTVRVYLIFCERVRLFSIDQHHGLGGVSSDGWGVSYSPSHICALKDSTVIMNCTYTYPTGHQIEKVFWTKKSVEPPDLSNDPEYSQRLQYLGDKQQNCTVRLSHVTLKDSHMYYFRFTTNDGSWFGNPGVTLTVTDLQVESPERVTEGDSVNLRCKSSCALTDRATFIWYRNSQPLTERRDRNNELLLQSVRREDSDRYSCAVDGHTHISPAVQLNVMYPPVKPVISISPSGVIVEGDSVTLNCISDSNPPAEISWIKGGTIVGSGRIYSISKISSDDSGEYKCKSINEHGGKYSDTVTLCVISVRCFSSVTAGVGVLLGGASGAFVMYICLTKRMNRRSAMKEISDPNEDTYTALELKSTTSDLSTGRFCSERRSTNEPILSYVGGATDD
ncbi:unnamed protein product [Leuciscus chuanchicus]